MKMIIRITAAICGLSLFANCTTTYDQYGNPQQSVDPGTAVAGAVAAGLIGAAIADNNTEPRRRPARPIRPVRPVRPVYPVRPVRPVRPLRPLR